MSEVSLLEYVRERLPAPTEKERLEEIARGATVPYHTLLKIAKGETEDPRVSTVQLLHDYFKQLEREAA
jgi:predicted transcriptional regulator